MEIKTDIKSIEDLWKLDKELILRCSPKLAEKLDSNLPTDKQLCQILIERQKYWKNPSEQIDSVTEVGVLIDPLVALVENIWKAKLEIPKIEILDPSVYLGRVQQLQTEVNKMFGGGMICRSPPTAYMAASHGKLLLPEKFIARQPRSRLAGGGVESLASPDFDVLEFPWDKPHFEEILFGEFCRAMFRQLRGEWQEGYTNTMKKLGGQKELGISQLNEVFMQYSKEQATLNNHPLWGLEVVSERISVVWGNRVSRMKYLGVDALSKKMPLSKVALVDDVSRIRGEYVNVDFYNQHPDYVRKKREFGEH